jgi:hypothetical protein
MLEACTSIFAVTVLIAIDTYGNCCLCWHADMWERILEVAQINMAGGGTLQNGAKDAAPAAVTVGSHSIWRHSDASTAGAEATGV